MLHVPWKKKSQFIDKNLIELLLNQNKLELFNFYPKKYLEFGNIKILPEFLMFCYFLVHWIDFYRVKGDCNYISYE